jgi:hypothetical protein
MYDYLVNERSNWEKPQEAIREAEQFRKAQAAQARNQPVSQRVPAPVRRAAQLVGALIR